MIFWMFHHSLSFALYILIYVSFHASKQVIGTLVIQPKIRIIFEKLNKDWILFIWEKGVVTTSSFIYQHQNDEWTRIIGFFIFYFYTRQSEASHPSVKTYTKSNLRDVQIFQLGGSLFQVSSSPSTRTLELDVCPELLQVCSWEMYSLASSHTSIWRAQNLLRCGIANHEQPSMQLLEKLNL